MTLSTDTFPTPFGPFSVAVNSAGALVATAFGDLSALAPRLPSAPGEFHVLRETRLRDHVRGQFLAYFAGERRGFDLPLAPTGTPFQLRAWAALQGIPFGETRTYGQLAGELGNAAASRAVGRANATNPLCVIIPCHRVIGSDGSLTGFAFGEERKRQLLELERTVAARRAA